MVVAGQLQPWHLRQGRGQQCLLLGGGERRDGRSVLFGLGPRCPLGFGPLVFGFGPLVFGLAAPLLGAYRPQS